MSQWVDQFQKHAVHQQLETLQSILLEIENLEEPSPDATVAIERLKQIQGLTRKNLTTLDPSLTPIGVLNNMNSQTQQVVSHCNQYRSTGDVGHLTNANNNADAVLIQLGSLPTLRNVESVSEAIISLRRSVGQYHRYIDDEREGTQAQIEAAKGNLETLENSISTQQTRLDEIASEFQRQFSESEERRRNEFAEGKRIMRIGLESSKKS